ncbi:MAG: GAF domain-containing protein [Microthrixaceae bacterium]
MSSTAPRYPHVLEDETRPVGAVSADSRRVESVGPMISTLRLAATLVCLLLAVLHYPNDRVYPVLGGSAAVAAGVVVVGYALFRSFRPIDSESEGGGTVPIILEAALYLTVVALTGMWASPFVFTLLPVVILAGYARGFGFAVPLSLSTAIAIAVPAFVLTKTRTDTTLALSMTGLLFLLAFVAGFGRRVTGQAGRERDVALVRLHRLAEANALLYSLHHLAQTLPAGFDMSEVVASAVGQIRELVDVDTVVVALYDETDRTWQVLRREGAEIPSRLALNALPRAAREAIESHCTVVDVGDDGPVTRFDERSGSGWYACLRARDTTIGFLALEHREADHFDLRRRNLLEGLAAPLAVAMDNARWFARLRTVGADEERNRIARDLHDRLGQSLAYLAIELDRIITYHDRGNRLATRSKRCETMSAVPCGRSATRSMTCARTSPTQPGWVRRSSATSNACVSEPESRSSSTSRSRFDHPSCRSGRFGASRRRRSPTSSATRRPPTSVSRGSAHTSTHGFASLMTESALQSGTPADWTVTECSACANGPPPSAPRSPSRVLLAQGRVSPASSIRTTSNGRRMRRQLHGAHDEPDPSHVGRRPPDVA